MTKVTGRELKELLGKAVGGIYFGKYLNNFFSECQKTDGAVILQYDDFTSINIPIDDGTKYINYAIAGEDEVEVWDGSTYFDYQFTIHNMEISFNITEKSNELSLEQFKEFVDHDYARYNVNSVDSGDLSVSMYDCILDVNLKSREIAINTGRLSDITIDMGIVDAIRNDTEEGGDVCFRIEFNTHITDLEIRPDRNIKELFRKID